MKVLALLSISILVCFSACRSLLVPSWFDNSVDTKIVSYASDEYVSVYAENLRLDDRFIVFDVELVNRGLMPFQFEMENITLIVNEIIDTGRPGDTAILEPIPAGQLQRRLERRMQSVSTGNFLMGFLGAALVVYDASRAAGGESVASSVRNVMAQSQKMDMAIAATIAGLGVAGNLNNNTFYRVGEELDRIDRYYLHSCEVPPGNSVRGLIYFRACAGLTYRLVVPLEGSEFAFNFRKAKQAEVSRLRGMVMP